MTPTIGVFDSGFGGLTVLRALVGAAAAGALCLSGRHGAAALRLQVPPHHRPLRRAERAIPGPRTGCRVPGHRLQHGQRAGSGRHSGCGPGSGAGRHRAGSRGRPRRLPHRRRAGDRHRRHCREPRLRRSLPRPGPARAGEGLSAARPAGRGGLDRAIPVTAEVIRIYLAELAPRPPPRA